MIEEQNLVSAFSNTEGDNEDGEDTFYPRAKVLGKEEKGFIW